MIVLDAYAVVALLRGERAADEVYALVSGVDPVCLTVLGLAEVVDRLIRLVEAGGEEVLLDLAELGLANPPDLDAATTLAAGLLRAQYYHRRLCAVSMADCVAAEVTRLYGGRLATSDPHLLDVCASEGIGVASLPDSQGNVWSPS